MHKDTTSQILDAAERLTEELGATGWSMSRLASAAGISRATLYRRFASQQDVLTALATQRGAPVDPALAAPVRERILDAVSSEARQMGLSQLSIARVAAAAHVGEVTVYRHFTDRKGLVTAWAKARSPLATLDRLPDPSQTRAVDLRESLVMALTHALQFELEHRISRVIAGPPDEDTAELVAHLEAMEQTGRMTLRAQIAHHVESGSLRGDPDLLTAMFIGMIPGLTLHLPGLHAEEVPALAARCVDLFLNGCLP